MNTIFAYLRDEKGEGAINTIAIIAGMALIAAAILGGMQLVAPEVGDRIIEVIRNAISGG